MHKSVAPLVWQYELNSYLIPKSLEDVDPSDQVKRPYEKGNSMHWITGHITHCRFLIAGINGLKIENPLGDLFGRGAKIKELSAYPTMEEINAHFKAVSETMMKELASVTEETLSKDGEFSPPTSDKSILGVIAFMAFHESYHVGQLAQIRTLFGYDQLSG